MADETNRTARRTRSMLPLSITSFVVAIVFLSAANGNAANDMEQNGVNEQIAVVMIPPKVMRLKRLTMNALHLASKNTRLRGTRSFTISIRSPDAPGGGGNGPSTPC